LEQIPICSFQNEENQPAKPKKLAEAAKLEQNALNMLLLKERYLEFGVDLVSVSAAESAASVLPQRLGRSLLKSPKRFNNNLLSSIIILL
jgi:hypothetical protein